VSFAVAGSTPAGSTPTTRAISTQGRNLLTKPGTSLGHQVGRRVFREGPKFVNYFQHIFPGGSEKNFRGASPLVTGPSLPQTPVSQRLTDGEDQHLLAEKRPNAKKCTSDTFQQLQPVLSGTTTKSKRSSMLSQGICPRRRIALPPCK